MLKKLVLSVAVVEALHFYVLQYQSQNVVDLLA